RVCDPRPRETTAPKIPARKSISALIMYLIWSASFASRRIWAGQVDTTVPVESLQYPRGCAGRHIWIRGEIRQRESVIIAAGGIIRNEVAWERHIRNEIAWQGRQLRARSDRQVIADIGE